MAINITQLIFDTIEYTEEPVQLVQIYMFISHKKYPCTEASIRSVLSTLVSKGLVKKVKYPKKPSYYCKPEWVGEDGMVKPDLDWSPYWKNKIKQNEVK